MHMCPSRLRLTPAWQVRNFKAGLELFQRVAVVAEEEGHHPDLHLEGWNKVYAVLSTHSIGRLQLRLAGSQLSMQDTVQGMTWAYKQGA